MNFVRFTLLTAVAAEALLSAVPRATAGLSCASTVCTESFSKPTATTNWDAVFSLDLFDPLLRGGTLTSVSYILTADVTGTAKAESQDASPSTITLNLQAALAANRPDGGATVVQIVPLVTTIFYATAYDGTTDYGGTSGATFAGLSASAGPVSATLTLPADLALFTGTGVTNFDVTATANSYGYGAGNLSTNFNTFADAAVTIQYDFRLDAPEPASIAILGVGLVGLGASRRCWQS